ncbi:MAG TPA: glycosyltransferase family 4 protein [Candidatus Portnoybacteria bacterium]|nr:glycosyltransferase family 4 protein [Candidatus Portnoybacteria bacterium]
MKKILIFSTAYFPLIGGAEVAVKEITDRLGEDFYFDLICARIKKELLPQEKFGRITVYRVGWGLGKIDKFLLPWQGARLAAKLHQEKNYSAIWAIMASFGGLAALFFKKKHQSVPYLLTLQEGDTPEHIHSRARFLGKYFAQIFQLASQITAISLYLKDFALRYGAKCPIEIVPNGVDLDLFSVELNALELQSLKEKIKKGPEDKLVIHTGRLTKKNALDDIILALKYLPQNIRFLSLGDGPDLKELKELAVKIGVEKRVIFLEQVSHKEMVKYLKVSDVFVRPSLSEGLGNSFLEAMAAGLPIIGTEVGGIPDFLINKKTGLFCEVANPKDLADKISLLLVDEKLRQELILSGQQLVAEKYEWHKITKQMEAIFNKLIV